VKLFKLTPPYTMTVQYTKAKWAENTMKHDDVERVDELTITQTRDKLSELVF
jgi:hypothetical protein